ncbi:cell envelope integrity protein TolA [Leyella stercorea]|uniref:cell envelope integrity protein TolA n=1 Tax=Leyella stercorea TaxID=363265 RepID=UPI001A441623|nr:cell envelope integrity protein TolA [Leyella stercorea]MBL6517350.1 cell envelope integrity protein TolA [Leyella stercorea]
MKKIVRGNDFTLRIPVKKIVNGEQVSFPLTDCTDIAVHVVSKYKRTALPFSIDKESNDVLLADVDGTTLSLGTYALEVTGVSEGANWRSYEYEQFAIVDNNASSDTVFEDNTGNTNIEDGNGDNANKGCMDVKIEGFTVDTALVVLPPVSARATIIELIANADAAIAAVRETEAAVKASEDMRVESETLRQSAEEQRAESEATRQTAETQRAESENERVANEEARKVNEEARVAAEEQRAVTFTELSEAANAAVGKVDEAVKSANAAIDKANVAEGERAEAERQRAGAEATRNREEGIRQESETERVRQETAREDAEATRQNAEVEREKADAEREKRVSEAISNTSSAAKTATDAAAVAMETAKQGMNVITEAERVNAELRGNVLVVTNRNGGVSALDFEQWDLEERVNITMTTSVAGVSVKGVSVNVFLNDSSAFTKYTTDADGKVSFAIPRGTMYRIAFQELKGCDPLPSITYTAALRVRDINVEYKPISDEKASVIVTIDKAENGNVIPFEGVAVTCVIDNGDTITTETDSEGKVTFRVPYNKKYKITAAQEDGYYAFRGVYEKNNVADVAEHNLYFHYYPTTSGVFILDATGAQYTADEWQAAGKTAEEAVLIKLVTQNLANGNNCFGFSPAALQAGYPNKQWCTQNTQFNNIPLNGNNVNDALYYDGVKQSKLVREEAEERGLSIPLFTYAYEQTVDLADVQLHGFILTIGQMTEANVNKTLVDEVVKMLHGSNAKLFSVLFTELKWTSTQNDAANAWNFRNNPYKNYRSNSYMALPVFAC